jgi:hypothetical protein
VITKPVRLKDWYFAYLRGEIPFEEVIAESERRIAEEERREGGSPVADSPSPER